MVSVAVIAAGDGVTLGEALAAQGCDVVVAADRGYKTARSAGCDVDVLVGDLDSLTDAGLADARDGAVARVVQHAPDKDHSDLELALAEARAVPGVTEIHVFGVRGGRADHAAVNLAVLGADTWAGVELVAHLGGTRLHVVRSRLHIDEPAGTVVTLLAHGGPAVGVDVDGVRWPLHDATLTPDRAWGLSNEVVAAPARVSVRDGVLFVFVVESVSEPEPPTGPRDG